METLISSLIQWGVILIIALTIINTFKYEIKALIRRMRKATFKGGGAEFHPAMDLGGDDESRKNKRNWLFRKPQNVSNLSLMFILIGFPVLMLFISPIVEDIICQKEMIISIPYTIVSKDNNAPLSNVEVYVSGRNADPQFSDENGYVEINLEAYGSYIPLVGCDNTDEGRVIDIVLVKGRYMCTFEYTIESISRDLSPEEIKFPTDSCIGYQ